jgi:hypothetical protein
MTKLLLPSLALLLACKDDTSKTRPEDTGGTVDTADTADTDTGSSDCTVTTESTSVRDGATDVYYRDTFTVSFTGDARAAGATVSLTDASGTAVTVESTWSEGNVQTSLSGVLAPETDHTLTVSVCGVDTVVNFRTSALGSPLEGEPSMLVGQTYVFRLSDSEITQPRFLDAVAGTYLTVPILVSVVAADASSIELIGSLGELQNDGSYRQVPREPTWAFPAADFTAHPYFEASADRIVLAYAGIDIPVEQFTLSGTFSADGTFLEEAVVTGFGDSRNMGALLGQADNPDAMCDLAEAAGVTCTDCADGAPYCLYIVAEEIDAAEVPGVSITPVP